MTVKQLIKELKKLPEYSFVAFKTNDPDMFKSVNSTKVINLEREEGEGTWVVVLTDEAPTKNFTKSDFYRNHKMVLDFNFPKNTNAYDLNENGGFKSIPK